MAESSSSSLSNKKLVIATRLHLGKAAEPPLESKLLGILENLETMANSSNATLVVAVDATPKISNYDYVEVMQKLAGNKNNIHILPVTPWGKFVTALNALVLYATNYLLADFIMFVSAEVNVSAASIQTLCQHLSHKKGGESIDNSTSSVLVAGAAMNGHLYKNNAETEKVELNGRTTPWNTLAVWNLHKLSLTGFPLCSDTMGNAAGVEECVTIALQQKIFPGTVAKLIKLEDVQWEETFEDEERQKWHDHKMKSKLERAGTQLERMQLTGDVIHC